jgi:hypothetical protein
LEDVIRVIEANFNRSAGAHLLCVPMPAVSWKAIYITGSSDFERSRLLPTCEALTDPIPGHVQVGEEQVAPPSS